MFVSEKLDENYIISKANSSTALLGEEGPILVYESIYNSYHKGNLDLLTKKQADDLLQTLPSHIVDSFLESCKGE